MMISIKKNGYSPLRSEYINGYVPSQPGVFALAVYLANGTYHPIYTTESDNLQDGLAGLLKPEEAAVPEEITEYLRTYQCYFTFHVTKGAETPGKSRFMEGIEKLLAETNDPVVRLKIFSMN
jgi:hypothetical protein